MKGDSGPIYRGAHAWWCCVTRGSLICHVAPQANPLRFAYLYSFLSLFSRLLSGAFWCSKWVMRGTVGKLEKSTFQRYQVFMNRSLNKKVMAPGSRGVWDVFLRFSDEDSSQTGDVTGEPRVACRNWSCSLS